MVRSLPSECLRSSRAAGARAGFASHSQVPKFALVRASSRDPVETRLSSHPECPRQALTPHSTQHILDVSLRCPRLLVLINTLACSTNTMSSADHLYRHSTLGTTLDQTLEDLVLENKITGASRIKLMDAFDKVRSLLARRPVLVAASRRVHASAIHASASPRRSHPSSLCCAPPGCLGCLQGGDCEDEL